MKYLGEANHGKALTNSRYYNKNCIPIATSKIVSITKRIKLLALISNVSLRTLSHLNYYARDDETPGTYKPESGDHEKMLAEQQQKLKDLDQKIKEQNKAGGGEKFPKYKPQ